MPTRVRRIRSVPAPAHARRTAPCRLPARSEASLVTPATPRNARNRPSPRPRPKCPTCHICQKRHKCVGFLGYLGFLDAGAGQTRALPFGLLAWLPCPPGPLQPGIRLQPTPYPRPLSPLPAAQRRRRIQPTVSTVSLLCWSSWPPWPPSSTGAGSWKAAKDGFGRLPWAVAPPCHGCPGLPPNQKHQRCHICHNCHYYVGSLGSLVSLQAGTGQTRMPALGSLGSLPQLGSLPPWPPRSRSQYPRQIGNMANCMVCAWRLGILAP
jgi:hypothetical protein